MPRVHARHVTVSLHMVHWLIHLHELIASWHHLLELLVTILRLGCRVVLPHMLIQEVWIHERHLLIGESHLIWHHHPIWELIHLTHVHDWSWLWHTALVRHVTTITAWSFVI